MSFSDYIIILTCIWIWSLFILFSTNRVYKFYLWVIFWFLIFLVINLQIKVLNLSMTWKEVLSPWFLTKNKDFVLGFSSLMIPIFWLFSAFSENEVSNKPVLSFAFGLFMPVFLLSTFSYILVNSSIKLDFLSSIMSLFDNSSIFSFFKGNTKYVFYFIVFVLFWRFIITLFWRFLTSFYEVLVEYFEKAKKLKK